MTTPCVSLKLSRLVQTMALLVVAIAVVFAVRSCDPAPSTPVIGQTILGKAGDDTMQSKSSLSHLIPTTMVAFTGLMTGLNKALNVSETSRGRVFVSGGVESRHAGMMGSAAMTLHHRCLTSSLSRTSARPTHDYFVGHGLSSPGNQRSCCGLQNTFSNQRTDPRAIHTVVGSVDGGLGVSFPNAGCRSVAGVECKWKPVVHAPQISILRQLLICPVPVLAEFGCGLDTRSQTEARESKAIHSVRRACAPSPVTGRTLEAGQNFPITETITLRQVQAVGIACESPKGLGTGAYEPLMQKRRAEHVPPPPATGLLPAPLCQKQNTFSQAGKLRACARVGKRGYLNRQNHSSKARVSAGQPRIHASFLYATEHQNGLTFAEQPTKQMITIQKSSTCDFANTTKETLLASSRQHIGDVVKAIAFFQAKLTEAAGEHDYDKLTTIDWFHADFLTGFKQTGWWDNHRKIHRHHIDKADGVPSDVNLLDVLEHIADCVMAGMARSGSVYELKLSDALLQEAFKNTVDLLKRQVEVQ